MAQNKIKIIVDGLRQVQALEKSLRNISRLADKVNGTGGGSKGNKTLQQETKIQRILNQIETKRNQILQLDVKNAKVSAAKGRLTRAENLANKGKIAEAEKELAIGTKRLTILKGETAEIVKQTKASAKMEAIRQGNFAGSGPGVFGPQPRRSFAQRIGIKRRFDFGSAAIGGGFPLLFGGGPLQAAAGALGGGIGGMFGKGGGFAGSIAATAVVQTIQQTVTAIADLGKAMGPFTQDTNALVNAMGLAGTAEAARLQIIEQLEGKQAAFNAAMQKMRETIGTEATNRLEEFGKTSQLIGSEFKIAMTKMQASLIPVINLVDKLLGLSKGANAAQQRRFIASSTDPEIVRRRERIAELRATTGGGRSGQKNREKEIELLEKELQLRAAMGIVEQETQTRADELTLEFTQHVKKFEEKLAVEKEVEKLMKGGMKQAVAEQIAQNNVLAEQARKRLQVELEIIKAKLANPDTDNLKPLIAAYNRIKELLLEIGVEQDKLNKLTIDHGNTVEKVKVTRQEIADLLANETTNAVMGLIEGTKTLGEALASIAKSLAKMFLNAAFQNIFNNMIVNSEQGSYSRAGGFKAFQYGGVVNQPTLGLMGEGGEPEYVIPASKMDGAMARYSAGARGGAVIPGGSGNSGTVAGGTGNTIVEYTGPVLNFNGDEYVPKTAVPEIINTAAKQGASAGRSQAFATLKNSRSQRATLGL